MFFFGIKFKVTNQSDKIFVNILTINSPGRGKGILKISIFQNSIPDLKDRAIDSFSIQSLYLN
jgi:hypothetical protein